MRVAVIDIGSNSVKALVVESRADGDVRVLDHASVITRLGGGIDNGGTLGADAMERTAAVVGRYVKAAREMGASAIRVVATSAVREAANRDAFVQTVRQLTGLEVEVLSGEEEGRLSYSAAAMDPRLGLSDGRTAVIDIGGGSTEITIGRGVDVESAVSIRIGAVRLLEGFLRSDPPSAAELAKATEHADRCIAEAVPHDSVNRIVGVGGTVINVGRVVSGTPVKRTSAVHALAVSAREVTDCLSRLASMTVERRKAVVGLEPKRADTIVGGNVVLDRVLAALGAPDMRVSTRGLRHGVAYEMLGLTPSPRPRQ